MKIQTPGPFAVTPLDLHGIDAICRQFQVSRRTVKSWIAEDAPIVWTGSSHKAEYNTLMHWLWCRGKKQHEKQNV